MMINSVVVAQQCEVVTGVLDNAVRDHPHVDGLGEEGEREREWERERESGRERLSHPTTD